MATCPYGKASVCFPLAIGRDAALGVIAEAEAADGQNRWKRSVTEASGMKKAMEGVLLHTDVAGYTTTKTCEAGASSVRLTVRPGSVAPPDAGAYLVALRGPGRAGWLPGLAAPRCGGAAGDADALPGLEVVVFGRADVRFSALMYLPEDTLRTLLPVEGSGKVAPQAEDDDDSDGFDDEDEAPSAGAKVRKGKDVEVRFLRHLLPVQKDCPPQWLRDRFLRLADATEEAYRGAGQVAGGQGELRVKLACAGLVWAQEKVPEAKDMVSKDEVSCWEEEMRLGLLCAAGVEVYKEGELSKPNLNPNIYTCPNRSDSSTDASASGCSRSSSVENLMMLSPRNADSGYEQDKTVTALHDDSTFLRLADSTDTMSSTIRQIVGRFGASSDIEAPSPKNDTAHSGDAYDPRWLEWEGAAEFTENFGVSGDGSIKNVGLNLAGTYCCALCSQQFSAQSALNVHTKFTHQVEEEQQGEWLSFPSA